MQKTKLREKIESNTEAILMQESFELSGSILITTNDGNQIEFSCEEFYPVLLDDGSIWIKSVERRKFVRKFNQEEIKELEFKNYYEVTTLT